MFEGGVFGTVTVADPLLETPDAMRYVKVDPPSTESQISTIPTAKVVVQITVCIVPDPQMTLEAGEVTAIAGAGTWVVKLHTSE